MGSNTSTLHLEDVGVLVRGSGREPSTCSSWWTRLWSKNRKAASSSAFDNLSEEEVVEFLANFKWSDDIAVGLRGPHGECSPAWRIAPDTVLKSCFAKTDFEAYTMALVSSQTTIPVPRVRRSFMWKGKQLIFMEYIEGTDLETAWPSLSLWRKLMIAWTIRGYIRQLWNIKLPKDSPPGPIDGTGTPLVCRGRSFPEYGAGPFASYNDMSTWFRRKLRITLAAERYPMPPSSRSIPFDDSMPLVLTHFDLNLRNIRIGLDGKIWLLDWGFSGAYPKWFEYSGIVAYDDGRGTPRLWLWLAPFMAGFYRSQHRFVERISWALFHWAVDLPAGQ